MTDLATTLRRGYPPEAHRVIACDYDGTIFRFGTLNDPDPSPLPGAVAGLRRLEAQGYRIVIVSSRLDPAWLDRSGHSADEMRALMETALRRHGIPFAEITGIKRAAAHYIDDRAVRLSDNWPEVVDFILWKDQDDLD